MSPLERDAMDQFRTAMQRAGLSPPDEICCDGEIHRFSTNGKPSDDAGWYVLFVDNIPAGAFGDWRTGLFEKWRGQIGRELTAAERNHQRLRLRVIKKRLEADEVARKAEARKKAEEIWNTAPPTPGDHPYLVAKGVKAYELRRHEDAYSGEVDRLFRRNVTGDSAESAL